MKKYLILLILLTNVTYAFDFTHEVNQSVLPVNFTDVIGIKYLENRTLNITYYNMSSGVSYINYTNETLLNLEIKTDIANTTEPGNYTEIVTLKDHYDNFTSVISILLVVINDTIINDTTPNATVEYVQLDINEFEYSICSYMLPWNRTKEITIGGHPGQTVYTNFDNKYFTLPTNIVIPDTNKTKVIINMHLANLSNGKHTKKVGFSVVGSFPNVTFHFVIEDCIQPVPTYDEYIRVCSVIDKTPEEQLECLKLETEYKQELYEAMLDAAETKVIVNHTVEYVNVTQRIPVLDLDDPNIIAILKDIPQTWKQMQTDQKSKDNKITDLQSQINTIQDNYSGEIQRIGKETQVQLNNNLKALINDNLYKDNVIKDYEEHYFKKSTIIWITVLVVTIILSIFSYKLWHDYNLW